MKRISLLSEFTLTPARIEDYAEYAFGRQLLGNAVTKAGRVPGMRGIAKVLNTPVPALASKRKALKRVKNIRKIRQSRPVPTVVATPQPTWGNKAMKYGRRAVIAGGTGATGYSLIASNTEKF